MRLADMDDLRHLVETAEWFSQLATSVDDDLVFPLSDLSPWGIESEGNDSVQTIANQMDWLPSALDQSDPISVVALEERAVVAGLKEVQTEAARQAYKFTLASLRSVTGHPALQVGPHDFSGAARGAALYASRRAACELVLRDAGVWCRLMSYYHQGHWPCGIMPTGVIVVL